MYRYVGFIWNPQKIGATRVAATFRSRFDDAKDWVRRLNIPGLIVFDRAPESEGMQAYLLPGDNGVVLGRLFPLKLDGWTAAWRAAISLTEARTIASTGGRHLVETYWGSYVAFINNSDDEHRYAIRDCSGKIPCYRTRNNEVEVIFADVGDISCLNLPHFTVNWRYIAAFVSSSQLQIRETGLNEVTELLAGESFVDDTNTRRQVSLWHPKRFCIENTIEDGHEAAKCLLLTTQQCISAWASVCGNILHSLSGGFDSAVVLGCLSRAPIRPAITCLNRFSGDVRGDERQFARIAAAKAGVKLIEQPWGANRCSLGDRLSSASKMLKPTIPAVIGLPIMDGRNEVAKQVGAHVFWTGEGGDHLFFQMKSLLGAADYVQCHGMGWRLPPVVRDAARLTKMSYWHALRLGLELGRSKSPWSPEETTHCTAGFLSAGARASAEYARYPWSENSEGIPKGKQLQIHYLSEVVNRARPLPGAEYAAEHHPLLSQPLMELCMRIPVYLLVRGGRSRGLARFAFRHIAPSEIIDRETKGTSTAYILGLLHQSRDYISDLLLDGVLVRQGILNRKALEPYVFRSQPLRAEQLAPFLASIAAEVWVQSWSDSWRRAAD
jgi:asparagine synthase (glutamine-hydrolysing)